MIFYESVKEYEPDFIVEIDNKMLLVKTKTKKLGRFKCSKQGKYNKTLV